MRAFCFSVAVLLSLSLQANEWRQFRGPDGQGHAAEAKNLPATWSESENVIWKSAIPGRGWSSPVFAGPTIWLTTAIEHELTGEALEAARAKKLEKNSLAKQMKVIDAVHLHAIGVNASTGEVQQNIELFKVTDLEPIHSLNSYASPSPVLDGDMLYCHFGALGTACVNTQIGKIVWQAHLPCKHAVGPGTTPIIHKDLIIVNCDGMEEQYVVRTQQIDRRSSLENTSSSDDGR